MEKWDSYSRRNDRMHFVLPSAILEEELASTKRVLEEKKMEEDYVKGYIKKGDAFATSPFGAMMEFSPNHHAVHQTQQNYDAATDNNLTTTTSAAARRSRRQHKPKNIFGTSPDSVSSDLTPPTVSNSKSKKKNQSSTATSSSSSSSSATKNFNEEHFTSNIRDEEEEDIDESLLEPEELLRRARSRLLEDLSEGGEDGLNGAGGGGLNGEKGVLTLPHSLGKYKEVRKREGGRERQSGNANNGRSTKNCIQTYRPHLIVTFSLLFNRCTIKMDASEYTLQPKELLSFKNLMPNEPVAYGTRRFGIIVVKIWQIDVCV
jgi:hypothetical protein